MSTHAMRALVPCRPVIDQNFYYAGLKFTGPTFACAMSNTLSAMTFVMAVIFRYGALSFRDETSVSVASPWEQPTAN